jgi:aspartate/glutamate racemase
MEQDFYVGRPRDRHGLDVLVPDPDERRIVHDAIYDELVLGQVNDCLEIRAPLEETLHLQSARAPART